MAINKEQVARWFSVFHCEGETVEIRVLDGKRTFSGYFRNASDIICALDTIQSGAIYSPLNLIKESCFARSQSNKIVMSPKATTSDNDIEGRRWLLIDFDPRRSSDTNATDGEKRKAYELMKTVGLFLQQQGFESPVIADSGNGYHLYYKIRMANTDTNTELIKSFLKVLDMFFSNDDVDIDTSVFNAARVCKVIGTASNKGTHTEERPQRMSCFVKIPSDINVTDIGYISKVADMMPKKDTSYRNAASSFDLDGFITEHGIRIQKRSRFKDGEKLILEHCPFDDNHKAPDAAIFALNDGSYGFRCLHNSCQGRTWRDFRMHYDPRAYDERSYREFRGKMAYERPLEKFVPIDETTDKGKKWLCLSDIKYVDMSKILTIPTGYHQLDSKIRGLMAGDVSVLSGLSGAGKTSWLDCVILNAVNKGFKVAVWSGELQGFRFQSWLNQIAAGRNNVVKMDGYYNLYYVPRMISDKINGWLSDKLLLYNNDYGNKWKQIFNDIKEIESKGYQLIILDNLAALDIQSEDSNTYEQQKRLINDIKDYAKNHNVHIIMVCHPRKEMQFLRKESISGTADLTNLADNVFIIHRVGKDFRDRAGLFFGDDKVKEFLGYNSVIEVAKNRSFGVVDYLAGMYYEYETRRLKNTQTENIIYGWDSKPEQLSFAPSAPSQYYSTPQSDDDFWSNSRTSEDAPF